MAEYRIFTFDFRGHVVAGSRAVAGTDQAALAFAETLLIAGERVVVWQGGRLVGAIDGPPAPGKLTARMVPPPAAPPSRAPGCRDTHRSAGRRPR